MPMQANLSFKDPILERAYQEAHALQQRSLEIHFHYARALAWAAVGVRAFTGRNYQAGVITTLGALTTVSPSFIALRLEDVYQRWRLPIIVADNVLQVALGCYTHDTIYPASFTGSWRSFFVLASGNGVAWLLFSSLWGSLTFQYMFPQQAALTIILLLYNPTLCHSSTALVHAYNAARLAAQRVLAALLPQEVLQQLGEAARLLPGLTGGAARAPCSAGGSAPGGGGDDAAAAAAWLAASCAGGSSGGGDEGVGAVSQAAQALIDGEKLCMVMQPITLLLLGFLFPTLYIYVSELRSRREFARRLMGPARAYLHAEGGHSLSVSWVDYFLFGIPAVACMFLYVIATS